MACKVFFCSDFPVIPEKWWRKEKEERQLRRVAFQEKIIIDFIALNARHHLKGLNVFIVMFY